MRKKPFFSILIPTRNRPHLIKIGLKSLKKQTFTDYEVIVSDNSDIKHRLKNKLIVKKINCDNIVYVTPDKTLSMPDNYEFALKHASGKYIGCLTDKLFFKKNALKELYDILIKDPVDIINYLYSSVYDNGLLLKYLSVSAYTKSSLDKKIVDYNPKEILKYRMSFRDRRTDMNYKYVLGKCLFGFYSVQLVTTIKEKHGRMFYPFCPDYTSTTLGLLHAKTLKYYNSDILAAYTSTISNGDCMERKHAYTLWFLQQDDKDLVMIDDFPIPGVAGIHNICAHSYDVINRTGDGNTPYKINTANLINHVAEDLNNFTDLSKEEKDKLWDKLNKFADKNYISMNVARNDSLTKETFTDKIVKSCSCPKEFYSKIKSLFIRVYAEFLGSENRSLSLESAVNTKVKQI